MAKLLLGFGRVPEHWIEHAVQVGDLVGDIGREHLQIGTGVGHGEPIGID